MSLGKNKLEFKVRVTEVTANQRYSFDGLHFDKYYSSRQRMLQVTALVLRLTLLLRSSKNEAIYIFLL